MRQKTQRLIEVLSEEISKGGTATTQQLKQTARSNGLNSGYVIPICNKNFRRVRHGVWCLKTAPVLFDPTPYQRPKKRCRLTEHDRKRLVQVALLEEGVIQFNERRFKEIARREGVEKLPKNINAALRKEIQKAYTELLDTVTSPSSSSSSEDSWVGNAGENAGEKLPETLDNLCDKGDLTPLPTPPSPFSRLSVLIEKRTEIEKEIEELLSPFRKYKAGELNLCCEVQLTEPEPCALEVKTNQKPLKVMIMSLLPSQITEFQRRPKIKAQTDNGRLSLVFNPQGRTSFKDFQEADFCVSMNKLSHRLWDRLVSKYGKKNTFLAHGMGGIESKILELVNAFRPILAQ